MPLENLAEKMKPGMRVEVSLNEMATYDAGLGYITPKRYAERWALPLPVDGKTDPPIAGRVLMGYVVGLTKSVKNPVLLLSMGYFHTIDAPRIQISSQVIDSIRELK